MCSTTNTLLWKNKCTQTDKMQHVNIEIKESQTLKI